MGKCTPKKTLFVFLLFDANNFLFQKQIGLWSDLGQICKDHGKIPKSHDITFFFFFPESPALLTVNVFHGQWSWYSELARSTISLQYWVGWVVARCGDTVWCLALCRDLQQP